MEAILNTKQKQSTSVIPMIIIGLLFFIFGFVTWLNGSLIPFLKIICQLSTFQSLYVTLVFYIAYTVMALPSSWLLARTGYKNGMACGLAVMVVGTLLFIPAANSANYVFFLIGLFILGTGLTILQTAANPYLVILGPKESAAMRISLMGIVNKGAGVIVPLVFSALILSDLGDTSEQALATLDEGQIQALSERLILPYLYMAGALVFLIALVKFSSLPGIEPEQPQDNNGQSGILQFPQVVLGALALFAYVGVEVIAGDTIGLFGADLGVSNFATLTSYTMVFMVLGYLIGIICIPKYLQQKNALITSGIAGSLCVFGIIVSSTESSSISGFLWGFTTIATIPDPVFFVALMGLSHALVWPAVWPLALDGLGKFTAQGSALLIMGISGGALIPMLYGGFAEANDTQSAYWVALPCYLFILFYAVKGHKMRAWKKSK